MEDSVSHESQSKQEGSTTALTELPQKASCELQKGEKISEEQQSQSFDSADGDRECQSSQEGTLLPALPQDNLHQRRSSSTGSHGVQFSKGGSRLSSTLDKVPDQQPGPSHGCAQLLQSDQQVKSSSRYSDKALDDGYNWRKYGQKLVKGNEFVRSYYRCTHPDCRAKRQVERSQGQITDTVYLGRHEHVKPQPGSQISVSSISPIRALRPEECSLAAVEDKSPNAHVSSPRSHEAQPVGSPQLDSTVPADNVLDSSTPQPNLTTSVIDHDGDPNSKRQKTEEFGVDETSVKKPNGEPRYVGEPRVVVQTMSEVDIWNDGYRWRKYGQKLVKGNPNPRSYYRCSSSRCPVKKHVERASYDPKVVITTYEGLHDHGMPPARTVMPTRANADERAVGDESRSRLEENSAAGRDMVVHVSAKSEACS